MDKLLLELILEFGNPEPYDGIGTIFGLDEFLNNVDHGYISIYDGFGELMIDNQVLSDTYVNNHSKTVSVIDLGDVTFEQLSEIFGDRVKICWYNR